MSATRLLPWIVRVVWASLPLTAAPAFAGALDERSGSVQTVLSVALWAVWAVVASASLVLHPMSLTVVRVVTPAAVVSAGVAGAAGASTGATALAIAATAVVALVAFLPETAMPYVNGPAYANERRFPLRPPGPLLFGPLPLAWALTAGMPAAAVVLLAAQRWIAGAVALAAAVVSVYVFGRSLHSLARRWVVFVPAGVVLHDPLTLADPVLVRRREVVSFAPAPADTDALDLTARALGLALQLETREPAQLALVNAGSRTASTATTAKLMFTPTRPGAVMAEATSRRYD